MSRREALVEKDLLEQADEYTARAAVEAGNGHPVAAREWLAAASEALLAAETIKRRGSLR